MCVGLIGGMDRLGKHYAAEAKQRGILLKVFNVPEASMAAKIRGVDALVIFTNKVSHRARREAVHVARSRKIPVFLHHSCGVCTFRRCLDCLKIRVEKG
ncbi:MAG: DUF2325 domain-containing protein [Deltaproteobacteria bacterium]|nr:DUF2325 domain-containing protein [Deltaproteobacteria bacterium]